MAKLDSKVAKRYGNDALLAVVLALNDMRKKNANGDWVLESTRGPLDIHDVQAILMSAVDLGDNLSPPEKQQVVSTGIFVAIKSQPITAESLLAAIRDEVRKLRRIRPRKFVMATHLSIDWGFLPIVNSRWGTSRIRISQSLPQKISLGSLNQQIVSLGLKWPNNNWAAVLVTAQGRSAEEAAYAAFDALNNIRAIWNFAKNRSLIHRMSSPVSRPVNNYRLGPLQTIHEPRGELASRCFWYEPPIVISNYPGSPVYLNGTDLAQIRRFERWVRTKLARLKYADELLGLLREYSAALDGTNFETIYLRLWAILEKLTACSDKTGKADHTTVVRRASFLWKDTKTIQLLLEHLRDVRNNSIHDLRSHEMVETCVYQLLRFIHQLLSFHIDWSGEFESLAEAGEFLQLSKDERSLKGQIRVREQGLRFLGLRRRKSK